VAPVPVPPPISRMTDELHEVHDLLVHEVAHGSPDDQ
jgi:hypothetical protein